MAWARIPGPPAALEELGEELDSIEGAATGEELGADDLDAQGAELDAIAGPLAGKERGCSPAPASWARMTAAAHRPRSPAR